MKSSLEYKIQIDLLTLNIIIWVLLFFKMLNKQIVSVFFCEMKREVKYLYPTLDHIKIFILLYWALNE